MSQFYAQSIDEDRCRQFLVAKTPMTITGLTIEGKIRAFTGIIQSVEAGHVIYPDYPLLITMSDSN